MTTQTSTLAAQSLNGVQWTEDGKVASFQSARLFGVTDGAGRWATFGGTRPGSWNRKATAEEIAATVDPGALVWIEAL